MLSHMTVSGLPVSAWLMRPRPQLKAVCRLFCFPYAGAGVAAYSGWADAFPNQIEVYLVALPGRENRLREAAYTHLPDLVSHMASGFPSVLDIPYAFFGHSMGALIAFELARALRLQARQSPKYVFVSGCRAPHLPAHARCLHTLPDPDLVQQLRIWQGTPDIVLDHPELMRLILPTLRADLTMYETYACVEADPLESEVIAFGGLDDLQVSRDELDGWQKHTKRPLKVAMFGGDHFFIHTHRTAVLRTIIDQLLE